MLLNISFHHNIHWWCRTPLRDPGNVTSPRVLVQKVWQVDRQRRSLIARRTMLSTHTVRRENRMCLLVVWIVTVTSFGNTWGSPLRAHVQGHVTSEMSAGPPWLFDTFSLDRVFHLLHHLTPLMSPHCPCPHPHQCPSRVGTLTRSECIIVIIYGWYQSFILISWWGYQYFVFYLQNERLNHTSKTNPKFISHFSPRGGWSPSKATPDRESATSRNFFGIFMFSIQKLMIFRGEIRSIPSLTRYQSIILINNLSFGQVRMYYFLIIIWCLYQCFFCILTVSIIYFDTYLS